MFSRILVIYGARRSLLFYLNLWARSNWQIYLFSFGRLLNFQSQHVLNYGKPFTPLCMASLQLFPQRCKLRLLLHPKMPLLAHWILERMTVLNWLRTPLFSFSPLFRSPGIILRACYSGWAPILPLIMWFVNPLPDLDDCSFCWLWWHQVHAVGTLYQRSWVPARAHGTSDAHAQCEWPLRW